MNKLIITFALVYLTGCAEYEKATKPPYTLSEKIYVDQIESDNYLLTFYASGPWKLYAGHDIQEIDWNEPEIIQQGDSVFMYENPDPGERIYFAAINPENDTIFVSEREIDMEGATNFRDLGGIETQDGLMVRWGKLYRSGELSELTEEDLATLKELEIKTILDLRGFDEIESDPDKYPQDGSIAWMHTPVGIEGENTREKFMAVIQNADPETFQGEEVMVDFGKQIFYESPDTFKPIFDQLLEENSYPLVFHCSAGKDRAGFTSALILYALGVSEEVIMDEYLLSNHFRYHENEKTIEQAAKYFGVDQRIMREIMAVKPTYLNAGFDLIKEEYGTIDKYLEVELGVDSTQRAILKAQLLYD